MRWPFGIADDNRSRECIPRAIADTGYPLASDDRARLRFLREIQSRIEHRKREARERAESRRGDYLNADVVNAHDISHIAARAWRSSETLDRGAFPLLDVETTTHHLERAETVVFGALPFSGREARGGHLLARPALVAHRDRP